MKRIWNNSHYLLLYCLLAVLFVLVGCEKKYELDLSLALATEEIHLESEEGKTKIMVYSTGDWQVSVKEETDWLTLDTKKGSGNEDILFSYNRNFGIARKATLVITKGDESKELTIIQNGQNASFRFSKSKYTVTRNPFHITLPILNDLESNIGRINVEYLYDDETSEQWVTNAKLTEKGFEFDLLENNYNRTRTVRLYLTVFDAQDKEYTVYTDVDQTTTNPTLTPRTVESILTRRPKMDTVIVRGNVGALFPEFQKTVSYEDGSDWIESVELANDSLLILAIRGNETGLQRKANVNLKLVNNGVTYINLTHRVTQTAQDYDFIDFATLKAMIPGEEGEIRISAPLRVLEGIVVGDANNNNMDVNPNTNYNAIDFTESPKTNYIQNIDGTSGFRLKFGSVAANILARYTKASISVDGLTLQKESNPTRYTIKGITSRNIVGQENTVPADYSIQQKYISELQDSDVYTFVKLKETTIAIPYGAFTNVNMGYVRTTSWNTNGAGANVAYLDAIPTGIYDSKGNSMKMIVNTANSWSRDALPTGVGSLAGIIVHNKIMRYGAGEGEIGRYSIRPVNKSDVDLYNGTNFSKLVEWRMFNPNTLGAAGTLTTNSSGYLPAIGEGRAYASTNVTATLGANPLFHSDPTSKVVPASGFQFSQRWWNGTTNSPEALILKFSTKGVSNANALMLNFNIGGGSGTVATFNVPVYWHVKYSTDGNNYSVVQNSDFTVRPLAGWNLNHNFTALGLNPYSVKLPNNLLSQENVYLRIEPKSNICATNLPNGGEGAEITSSQNNGAVNVRFGTVMINYIQ
ncbi:MAG: BACON domain-containing protein [Sphingobacterium composti]